MTKQERIDAYTMRQKHSDNEQNKISKLNARMKTQDPIIWQQSVVRQRIEELKSDLPHLYGYKMYPWAREFFESTNRMNLLCAANQIGKSSIAIRKNIEWACNKKLWPKIWESKPQQFWYFYPDSSTATSEFEKKWVPEFMPRGEMKNHENYGWDADYSHGDISAIHFRSGVSIYFKTYGQKVLNLQSSTVHMITADEEMPEEFINELLARLRSNRGIFNQVFTPTRALPVWYRAMECIGQQDEMFPNAWKRSVSMRDSMFYDDGTPSKWTAERIAEAESQCTSKNEVLKRIDGRFVRDGGRLFGAFDPDHNIYRLIGGEDEAIKWKCYAGVDIGSGGAKRSAGAIIILAVNEDNTIGKVIRSWRGDNEETTASDILRKYAALRRGLAIQQACYDYQSREFGLIAARQGESFVPADKSRETGAQITNMLFQARRLLIADGEFDNHKLVTELMSVPDGVKKNRSYQDDLTDALRYCVRLVPWDFNKISPDYVHYEVKSDEEDTDERSIKREDHQRPNSDDWRIFEEEVAAWNELYGN